MSIINIFRYIIAVTFIASGLLKGISIDATEHSIRSYLGLLGLPSDMAPLSALSVMICLGEFVVGILALNK